jgi:preprotein translocase subunit SecD
MGKEIRWRVLLIVAVIGACLWAIIPPAQKIRLGLDLRGGSHLVLRVNTDDALRLETVTTMERVRDELDRAGITIGAVKDLNPTQFQVSGVSPAGRVVPADGHRPRPTSAASRGRGARSR